MLEFQRVEISTNSPDFSYHFKPVSYTTDTILFKIQKNKAKFDFYYGSDRRNWINLLSEHKNKSLSEDIELFFCVLSAHNPYKANAEFSNFIVKLPKNDCLKIVEERKKQSTNILVLNDKIKIEKPVVLTSSAWNKIQANALQQDISTSELIEQWAQKLEAE